MFDGCVERFARFLKTIDRYADDLLAIGENRPPAPRWDQVWFPRLDACAAYAMVRSTQPERIVEIGAGHSTRFLARAIRDGGLATRLTTIDPAPRAPIDGLGAQWIARPVQEVPLPAFEAGDVLFIDSSHVYAPGSDVAYLLDEVVPTLPPGVLVHVHDIFLPDPYPPEWSARRYSEQPAVERLLANGGFSIGFSSRYVVTRMPQTLAATVVGRLPLPAGAFENSLWLIKAG